MDECHRGESANCAGDQGDDHISKGEEGVFLAFAGSALSTSPFSAGDDRDVKASEQQRNGEPDVDGMTLSLLFIRSGIDREWGRLPWQACHWSQVCLLETCPFHLFHLP